ncbi:DUF4142 domain-containing protein [Aquabacterium sp. A7-Y]|uniref:DUF4142 domain-containing protein n=1 Tax=Aquabacterium sp. A7-Y TaxID=1349605 RepID=UPI00223DDABB|nr:DUF4142 domain-containing protein [Aquabacterium sp. A7-Y]MCW7539245.1 DUF4142 domain-containing protein [Aquabacterium sp. A7-Y]
MTYRVSVMVAALAFGSAVAAQGLQKSDVAFLKQAAQNNHAEVESSKVAQTKASHADVKAFAARMIEDHTKAGDELKALAASKGVEVPDEASVMQKAKTKVLSAMDGDKFDRRYVDEMGVDAHQETIKLFTRAAAEAKDAEVKAFAGKTLPSLQHHLKTAQELDAALRRR